MDKWEPRGDWNEPAASWEMVGSRGVDDKAGMRSVTYL